MLRSRENWLFSLLQKILRGKKGRWLDLMDESAESIIFGNEGQSGRNREIKYAKVDMFHYRMEDSLWKLVLRKQKQELVWWKRNYEEPLVPPVVFDNTTGSLRHASLE